LWSKFCLNTQPGRFKTEIDDEQWNLIMKPVVFQACAAVAAMLFMETFNCRHEPMLWPTTGHTGPEDKPQPWHDESLKVLFGKVNGNPLMFMNMWVAEMLGPANAITRCFVANGRKISHFNNP